MVDHEEPPLLEKESLDIEADDVYEHDQPLLGRSTLQSQLDLEEQPLLKARPRATKFLDGLRGIACVCVYMQHSLIHMWGEHPYVESGFGYQCQYSIFQFPFLRTWVTGGHAAVTIFFVLSGYVLSMSSLRLLRGRDHTKVYQNLAAALVRRPIRLFIPVIGISLVFALIMQLPVSIRPIITYPPPQDNLLLELRNWFVNS